MEISLLCEEEIENDAEALSCLLSGFGSHAHLGLVRYPVCK